MSKAKKEEQKMGTDELQMHILMEKIDGMVENLPKYLKQNIEIGRASCRERV